MTSTRFLTVITFVAASAGLIMISTGDPLAVTIPGAMLVVGSAIGLSRHFWRESDRRGKRLAEANTRSLESEIGEVSRRVDVFTKGVLEHIAQLELDQATNQRRLQKHLDSSDRLALRYQRSITSEISGVVSLYATLKPTKPYPQFGGWAIGGDCAQRLVSLVLEMRPRWVFEAGSGLSTILVSQALELVGQEGQIISLEHDPEWLERSIALVAQHGVSHRSQTFFAPVVDHVIGGEAFPWYDLNGLQLPRDIEVMFIDGPPKATGSLARYPALPLLHGHLARGGVLLLDDADRPDERAVVDRWMQEFPELGFRRHTDAKGTVEVIKGKP